MIYKRGAFEPKGEEDHSQMLALRRAQTVNKAKEDADELIKE